MLGLKMKFNKGERLALIVLPKLGFENIMKEKFVDFSAYYKGKRVLVEVKYRKHISTSCKITRKQLREADFLLIVNEKQHKLISMSDVKKCEVTDYRIFF